MKNVIEKNGKLHRTPLMLRSPNVYGYIVSMPCKIDAINVLHWDMES